MGVYVNPPKTIFSRYTEDEIYVDKSGIFKSLNDWLGKDSGYVCLTRPRRFGKSMAAAMIAAYYCNAYDSHDLFDKLAVHRLKSYEQHINKYAVVSFDAQELRDYVNDPMEFVPMVYQQIGKELKKVWPDAVTEGDALGKMLKDINAATGTKFVVIIDEWDSIFRRDKTNKEATKAWVQCLRTLFKSASARQYIALAYITGILPIKKYDVESSLNVFREYTMIDSRPLESFFGFTEKEVQKLCKKYKVDFDETKRWYDGYQIVKEFSIYNPTAVVQTMQRKMFNVYWTQTGAFDVLKDYINMDFEGLRDAISQMIVGVRYPVDTTGFNTSLEISNRDHVLTALIHLGYLTYDFETKLAWIPNEEIRSVMQTAITESHWDYSIKQNQRSREFMDAIVRKDSDLAAKIIEDIHDDISVPIHYNSEGDLTTTLLFATNAARNCCIIGRELPSCRGYADLVLIPTKPGCNMIPTIFELKLDDSTESAIKQVEDRKYFSVNDLQNYHGEVLAVAMVYDRKAKSHQCAMRTFVV
ncbi:MAG: AAA family ATPase [Proteobacteria bacterium]|nr:AAA family ATPase [Pseudomonadota bacterium]